MAAAGAEASGLPSGMSGTVFKPDGTTDVLRKGSEAEIRTLERGVALGYDAVCFYNLAMRCSDGLGVPRDTARARILFERAIEMGCVEAQYVLGFKLVRGELDAVDLAGGTALLLRAAHASFAPAQRMMSIAYAKGEGVPRDSRKAAEWAALADAAAPHEPPIGSAIFM